MKKRMICLFLCLVMVLGLALPAAAETLGDPVNLAREDGATVTVDHSTANDVASHLNDGIISAREGGQYDAGPKNLWNNWASTKYASADVTIDFGKVCDVASMKWYAFADGVGTALPAKIEVQVPDGTDWKTIHTVDSASSQGVQVTDLAYTKDCYNNNALFLYVITLREAVATQEIRLHLTAQTGKALGASEWELYGKDSTPEPENLVNLADPKFGGAMQAGYTNPGDSVDQLVDGIISARENDALDGGPRSRWTTWYGSVGAVHPEQWVELDLTAPQQVKTVKWYAFKDGGGVQLPKDIHIQYWDDASGTWAEAGVVSDHVRFENEYTQNCFGNVQELHLYTLTLDKMVETQKIKLVFTPDGRAVGGTELEVYGTFHVPGGFEVSLGACQNGELTGTVLVDAKEDAQSVYLKLEDQAGTVIQKQVNIPAGETEASFTVDTSNLRVGTVQVKASLSPDYSNAKTYSFEVPIPDSIIEDIYDEVKTPYEYDVVLKNSSNSSDFDNALVDNPNIFTIPGDDEYVYMTYVGHDGVGYRTGLARSRDMLTWEKLGVILDNGEEGAWDEFNAAGYIVRDHEWGSVPTPHVMENGAYTGQLAMTYLASNQAGYEAGIKKAGVAFAGSIFNDNGTLTQWTRYADPVLDASDGKYSYEKGTIWKLQAIWDKDTQKYYGFYNAASGPEVMCGAVSDDLIHWTRMENNPLLDKDTSPSGGAWGNSHNADADVVKIGDYWVMFYFTSSPNGGGIIDSFAVSADLVNWQKSYMPLTTRNSTWSSTYAHKPCVVKHNGVVYHYYCAVGDQGRVIAVDTSIDLTILKQAQAIDTSKLTEFQKNLLHTAISGLQHELLKENGSLEEIETAVQQLEMAVRTADTVITDITLAVSGAEKTTVDADKLTFTVSAKDMVNTATATLTMTLSDDVLAEPEVTALNDWFIIAKTYADGVLTVVMGNRSGVTSAEPVDILSITAAPTGKAGTATVTVTDAVLSAYIGEGEAYVSAILDNASVSTVVDYSIYDVNRDGVVNQLDLTRAQRWYGTADPVCDVDKSGEVNIADLILILNNYTK